MKSAEDFVASARKLLASAPSREARREAGSLISRRLRRGGGGRRAIRELLGFWSLLGIATAAAFARLLWLSGGGGCLLKSPAWVLELSRLPSNCTAMCAGLTRVPAVEATNLTAETFQRLYAYTGRPVLVKNAASGWRAGAHFSYEFIRDMHDRHPSAYGDSRRLKVIDPFNVEFATLREALHMSEERRKRPFYFGWKNLNRGVFKELQGYHERPSYLGPEIEHPAADWFYIGTAARAALLHIDWFSRPSWQAQISGRKRWHLHPPVECESVCSPLQVDIEPGDILNVDPNQWYHATHVLDGTMSITLGSEFM